MKSQLFFMVFLLLITKVSKSQTYPEHSIHLEQKIEQNASSGEDEIDYTELTEALSEFLRRPLNINRCSRDDFFESGLFTNLQIVHLLQHIEKFGQLICIQELQVVSGFTDDNIRQLSPYVTTGNDLDDPNASFGRMLIEGTHQIISRVQMVLEERKGFSNKYGEPDYLGSPQSIYFRYRFNFMKKLSWSFVADKDAGEEFFKGSQKKGFDFYSGHVALRKTGIINLVVVGDFQLDYGQGLTLSTGMSGGKSSDPTLIGRNAIGIKPYTSSNESQFKRGVAVSLKRHRFKIDAYLSSRKLDGNVAAVPDTLAQDDIFTSLQESGYHRTKNEFENKQTIKEISFGTHGGFSTRNVRLGITAQYTSFNIPFIKSSAPYNQFDFSGRSLLNVGADYSWLIRNIQLFGEIAMSDNSVFATVNGAVLSLDPRLTVSILHRYYPRNFQSLTASAFKESGNNYNEQGISCGFNFRPVRVLSFTCNYDRFYFPWLRYRVNGPSEGYDFNMLLTYKPNRKSELYIRYRESNKMINDSEGELATHFLVPVVQRGIRFHVTTKISKNFTLRTRLEMVKFIQESRNEKGFMIFQDVQFHPMGFPLSFNLRYSLFDTDSYDSRIYAYENDVLYGYSIPAYYYKGSRFYFNTRIKIRKGIDAWFRYAATFYSNRNVIGSGLDEIQGSRKSEVKVQVRFEF